MNTSPAETLVINRTSGVSIPEQIVRTVRELLAKGLLRPGEAMPASRKLAAAVGVSRGSVVAAYDQLVAEGILESRRGSGVRVSSDAAIAPPQSSPWPSRTAQPRSKSESELCPPPGNPPRRPSDRAATPVLFDGVPGHDAAQPLTDTTWRRAWRDAVNPPRAATPPPSGPQRSHDGQPPMDSFGLPALRTAIAEHLRLMRAMNVDAERVLVTGGARDGLAVTLRAFTARLQRPPVVAVESPGFPGLRRALENTFVTVIPCDSDTNGPLPPPTKPDLVLLTPNHQFPYGAPLSAGRRNELLAWADDASVWVVEDDYDSEFRHLGPPLPTMWSLAPERVIHLGTFTQVLGRDVGTGYVLVPDALQPHMAAARYATGAAVAPILQRALAQYLDEGGLRRRIARGRRRLNRAQGRVQAQTARADERLKVVNTGHLLIVECPHADAAKLQARCRERGVAIGMLADGWSSAPDLDGVVLAYGNARDEEAGYAAGVLIDEANTLAR